ncbi:high-affinity branched-chain amino acid ABC transporter permease LivM [Taklimakanibacter lacteus]|uniref:high-affinity branched-chain amino acid ABC transporter permease LivM n=1 Tax=Taklimakanibacter lacteus TaxID=2268456 RepID=UPI0034D7102E
MTAATQQSQAGTDYRRIFIDTALTALIALAIIGPIVGMNATAPQGGLVLEYRWTMVFWLVAIIAAGRLFLQLLVWNRPAWVEPIHIKRTGAAAIAIGAVALLVGLSNMDSPVGFLAQIHPSLAAWMIAFGVFALVLGIWLMTSATKEIAEARGAQTGGLMRAVEPYGKYVGVALFLIAVVLPFIPGVDRRIVDLAILMLTYVMLGWGLNIVVGLAGLLDLGYVAFYAVGAYSYALLSTVYFPLWFGEGITPWTFWLVLPLAGLLAACWGIILGFPVLRLRGDYLAIVTLAFGEIIRVILINWYDFTGGPNGVSDIPRPSFFGIPFSNDENGFAATFGLTYSPLQRIIFLYYVILVLALITNFVTTRLRKLPVGRAWEALREDEIACRSLGINTTNTKLTAFAIGAMFGGFAGSFFATRQGFVSPESFVFMESAIILAIVVLGGLGSQIGVVIASIVVIGAFEVFREMAFLKAIMPAGFDPVQFRMLAVGIAMVLIMRWRPRGLITKRDPSIYLKEKKAVSADLVAQGHG